MKQIGGRGSALGEFSRAHDIEYHKGVLYAGDQGNNRIQIVDAMLRPIKIFGAAGASFNEPKYLTLATEDRLYDTDQDNNRLIVSDKDGGVIVEVVKTAGENLDRIEGVSV